MNQQTQKQIEDWLYLYAPHPIQKQLHYSNRRFRVAAWGRQAGKSTWGNNELAKEAWQNESTTHWFVSPTFAQARVQFRRFIGMLQPCKEVLEHISETELYVLLANGSRIFWKSGEVFDNLRGDTLNSCIIDEIADQHRDLWPMIIRPMLATTRGRCTFIGTPKGFNHFYDLAQTAQSDPDWAFFQAASTCNPLFTKEEFEAAKKTMSEAQFAQEILAEFRDLTTGKAYINFSKDNILDHNPFTKEADGGPNPYLPILVAMDFNLSPMSWVLAQRKGDHIHFFDEIFLKGSNTQEATLHLIDKVQKHRTGVIIVGDAAGRAGQRAAAGQSDYDILCQMLDRANVKWENLTPESNPLVKDRVNIVNARLKSAEGTVHVTLDSKKCPQLKKDFERVVWKDSVSTVALDKSTDPDLTHSSDAAGYLICQLLPVHSQEIGKMKVIRRW